MIAKERHVQFFVHRVLLILLSGLTARAQTMQTIRGKIVDPVGYPVSQAKITVLEQNNEVGEGTADSEGAFSVNLPSSGTYGVRVVAQGFTEQVVPSFFLGNGRTVEIQIQLSVGSLTQQIVVTAAGTAIPESQTGASISVIDSEQIQALNKFDVLEVVRLVPGAQIVQTSQRGGTTSLFLRGGDSDFNKVLIDGIPANVSTARPRVRLTFDSFAYSCK